MGCGETRGEAPARTPATPSPRSTHTLPQRCRASEKARRRRAAPPPGPPQGAPDRPTPGPAPRPRPERRPKPLRPPPGWATSSSCPVRGFPRRDQGGAPRARRAARVAQPQRLARTWTRAASTTTIRTPTRSRQDTRPQGRGSRGPGFRGQQPGIGDPRQRGHPPMLPGAEHDRPHTRRDKVGRPDKARTSLTRAGGARCKPPHRRTALPSIPVQRGIHRRNHMVQPGIRRSRRQPKVKNQPVNLGHNQHQRKRPLNHKAKEPAQDTATRPQPHPHSTQPHPRAQARSQHTQ